MNKYLEKLAKMNIKKTVDLVRGKRLSKAQSHVDKRLPAAIRERGKGTATKKFINARLHRDRVSILTSKSRKIAGGSTAVAGTATAGIAYKASKDKK